MTNHTTPTQPHLFAGFVAAIVLMVGAVILTLVLVLSTMDSTGTTPPSLSSDPTTPTSIARTGESAIYPGSDLDYRDGAWWVDGVKVTGVDCPTEDSCYPMEHDGGWMIHETTP